MSSSGHKLCPVCGLKKLAGKHETVCIRERPLDWYMYYNDKVQVSAARMGRLETSEVLKCVSSQ